MLVLAAFSSGSEDLALVQGLGTEGAAASAEEAVIAVRAAQAGLEMDAWMSLPKLPGGDARVCVPGRAAGTGGKHACQVSVWLTAVWPSSLLPVSRASDPCRHLNLSSRP